MSSDVRNDGLNSDSMEARGNSEPRRVFGRPTAGMLACAGVLGAVLVASYWDAIANCVDRWSSDPDSSHGFLVPFVAGYLAWTRRGLLSGRSLAGSWWGVLLIALGAGSLFGATYYYYRLLAPYSLLPILAGVVLLLMGWNGLRWAAPSVAFLFFMVPLPGAVATAMGSPLQRAATKVSTYVIQVLGIPAFSEGNVIVLSETEVGVAEACSGLRMLVSFFAVSTVVALMVRRPLWEKLLLVASAAPIAIAANITRVAVTAALHEWVGSEIADLVFHDLAGWLMIPMALGMLALEMQFLNRLLLAPISPATDQLSMILGTPASSRSTKTLAAGKSTKKRRREGSKTSQRN